MKLLVTGATGFVGRELVPALAAKGHSIRAASRGPTSFARDVETVRHGELMNSIDWSRAVDGVDAVIHLAGLAHSTRQLPDSEYDHINRGTTADLARAAVNAGVRHFVFLSSIRAQCGPTATRVLTEQDPPSPIDSYGRSKLAAEAAIRDSGIAHTILRPVLIYGRELKGNLATLRRLSATRLPLPFGAFYNRRSLLSLSHLISAVEHVIQGPRNGETYVVADKSPIALRDIIGAFRDGLGRRSALVPVPVSLMRGALRLVGGADLWERVGGELVVDASKLIATGWHPASDTKRELARLV